MSRQDIEYNLSNRLSQENHSVLALMESFSESGVEFEVLTSGSCSGGSIVNVV